MNYILTDNATGEKFEAPFKLTDFHASVGIPKNSEPTREHGQRQVDIWNRSQKAHRQEFSYRLV